MVVEIEVNGQLLKTRKGSILLDVLKKNGIRVPTLCSMEGFAPTGACRLCVVEVEGKADLVPACSYPVDEWMKVQTHSARVIQSRRTIVELLISSHPDECLYCFQNQQCELQQLATELKVTERKGRPDSAKFKIDRTSPSMIHDASKCVLCARCIRICDQQKVSALEFISRGVGLRVGTVGNKGLNYSPCISCGQCIQSCPTGSLQEKVHIDELITYLHEGQSPLIGLIDPAVMVSIGDELGFRSGKDVSALVYSALRKIGFKQVHSGSESVDITLFQTAELWKKRAQEASGPTILSFCPSWIQYLENLRPDLLHLVLPVLTPSQTFGRLIKRKNPDSCIVYFTSCIAAKMDSQKGQNQGNAKPYVDFVMSARELIQLIRLFGIDFEKITPEVPDTMLEAVPMSGLLSAVSGGYLEGLMSALSVIDHGNYPLKTRYTKFRGFKACKNNLMTDYKPVQRWIACSSIAEGLRRIDQSLNSKYPELFEIMACPGGCVNGGGQPGQRNEKATRSRIREVYDLDTALSGQIGRLAEGAMKANRKLSVPKFKKREV